MSVAAAQVSEIPRPDIPSGKRPGMDLPPTAWLWFAILLLSYVLPSLIGTLKITTSKSAASEYRLSTPDFENYLEAEIQTRTGLASDIIADPTGQLAKQRGDALKKAEDLYRKMFRATSAPNMARRVLILRHARSQSFDSDLALKSLPMALKADKGSASDIQREVRLWHDLYDSKRVAASEIPDDARRIRAMHLNFLEDLALADLYRAGGDTKTAAQFESAIHEKASVSQRTIFLITLLLILSGILGFILLVVFLVAAANRDWRAIGREASAPLKLGWGDLMDAFLFYLAAFKGMGLLISLVLERSGRNLATRDRLLLVLALEVVIGLVGVAYINAAARRRGTTLADIGLTTRGKLFSNIGYGITAYITGLPLILAAGMLAKLIFRHSTGTAPNPVLPLLVGQHDLTGKLLIFALASICAPLFEEFFFRGVLYTGLRTRYSWGVSAAVSAIVFAMMHPMQDWLPIFVLGFTLATAREMRQSLVPGVGMHFLQNTSSFIYITTLFRS